MYTVENIREILVTNFPGLTLLEQEHTATDRFRNKNTIIFQQISTNGETRVLKYYGLHHIENSHRDTERETLEEEVHLVRRFGAHPHIVRFLEASNLVHDGELIGFYIVMEKFDKTLQDYLKEKVQFSTREVLDFLSQMHDILETAHYKLNEPIVHSDIKPANIGVRIKPDGRVEYALMDFDVSVALTHASDSSEEFTLSNKSEMRGLTPAYAPPEQIIAYLHKSGNISNRVDIYAVGAIAMQMMTGNPPVKDESMAYYRLPFSQLDEKWKTIFLHLCNPDAKFRSRRIFDGLEAKMLPSNYQFGAGLSSEAEETILVKRSEFEYHHPDDHANRDNSNLASRNFLMAAIILCFILLSYFTLKFVSPPASVETVQNRTVSNSPPVRMPEFERNSATEERSEEIREGKPVPKEPAPRPAPVRQEPRQLVVPDIIGLTYTEAERKLGENGLRVGQVVFIPTQQRNYGRIINSNPRPEQIRYANNNEVDLIVGQSPSN